MRPTRFCYQALVSLKDATLLSLNSSGKTPQKIFPGPQNLTIDSKETWAIIGTHKTKMLEILAAQHLVSPALSRSYPILVNTDTWPSSAVSYLEFKNRNVPKVHLSARFEYFKAVEDKTLREFLVGSQINTTKGIEIDEDHLSEVLDKLGLSGMQDRLVMGFSNGQTRRARMAKALVSKPKILIIDEPFLGLDPTAKKTVSDVLGSMTPNPYLIVGLRYQDPLPDWITHVAVVGKKGIIVAGEKNNVINHVSDAKTKDEDLMFLNEKLAEEEAKLSVKIEKDSEFLRNRKERLEKAKPAIVFNGASVAYNGKPVFEGLTFTVKEGERWHIRGDNGTGKSTLFALITADHPQAWKGQLSLFGTLYKIGKTNYFDINDQIGLAAPELHGVFPMEKLTVFQTISTGFLVGSYVPIPKEKLTEEQIAAINDLILEFGLEPEKIVSELSLSDQKTVFFARALVKKPKILLLDEAFSTMEEARIEQCKDIVDAYDGTVLFIAHEGSEIGHCDKYLKLNAGGSPEIGDVE